jgi:hypothetical protein
MWTCLPKMRCQRKRHSVLQMGSTTPACTFSLVSRIVSLASDSACEDQQFRHVLSTPQGLLFLKVCFMLKYWAEHPSSHMVCSVPSIHVFLSGISLVLYRLPISGRSSVLLAVHSITAWGYCRWLGLCGSQQDGHSFESFVPEGIH